MKKKTKAKPKPAAGVITGTPVKLPRRGQPMPRRPIAIGGVRG